MASGSVGIPMMTEVSKTGYDTTPQDLEGKVEGSMSSEDTGLVMAKTLGRGGEMASLCMHAG